MTHAYIHSYLCVQMSISEFWERHSVYIFQIIIVFLQYSTLISDIQSARAMNWIQIALI